jgi:hypothetical protein
MTEKSAFDRRQDLFDLIVQELGVTPTEGQMDDIINEVEKLLGNEHCNLNPDYTQYLKQQGVTICPQCNKKL